MNFEPALALVLLSLFGGAGFVLGLLTTMPTPSISTHTR